MGASKGNSNLSVGTRTPPAAVIPPATVTAAAEGLSLNGTIVELGNASILSALPQITVSRFIPVTPGAVVALTSSNIATPANTNQISPSRVQLDWNSGGTAPSLQINDNRTAIAQNNLSASAGAVELTRTNVAGTVPIVFLEDQTTGAQNLSIPRGLTISGSATALPFLLVQGPGATITFTGGATAAPTLELRRTAFLPTNIQTHDTITLTDGAGPKIIVNGANAAGTVIASQYRNTSAAAAASVLSQWYVDSTTSDFEIVKYSDANVASGNAGGIDLVHNNATVPTSMLRLLASSATAIIRATIGGGGNAVLNLDRGGGTYTLGDVNSTANGTTVSAEDVSSLTRIRGNNGLVVQNVAGQIWAQVTAGGLSLGIAGTNIGRLLISGNTSGTITIQPQAAAGTYNFNLPITAGASGDLLASGGGGAAPMIYVQQNALPYIAVTGTTALTGIAAIDINSNNPFNIVDGANIYLSIDTNTRTYQLGDVSDVNGRTKLIINDNTGQTFLSNNVSATAGLYINLAAPSTFSPFAVTGIPVFASDALAAAGGLITGEFYQTTVGGITFVCVVP